jgi:hypothetical protein
MFPAQTVSVLVRLATNRKRCGCKNHQIPTQKRFWHMAKWGFSLHLRGQAKTGAGPPARQSHPRCSDAPSRARSAGPCHRPARPTAANDHPAPWQWPECAASAWRHRPRRLRPQLRNTQILACNLDCRHAARSANQRRAASGHVCGYLGIPPGVRFSGG